MIFRPITTPMVKTQAPENKHMVPRIRCSRTKASKLDKRGDPGTLKKEQSGPNDSRRVVKQLRQSHRHTQTGAKAAQVTLIEVQPQRGTRNGSPNICPW